MPAVTINAGDLNRRITVQARTTGLDGFGQQATTWTDAFSTWAAIAPLSGRELLAAQAVNAETTHEVVIRYRPTGVSPASRVLYQGRVLNVLSVIDVDTEHVYLSLLCSEGLNQG